MEWLFAIFLAMFVCGTITEYFKQKAKMGQLETKIDQSEKVNLQEEIDSIKHRLVVLEKIVTDKGYQVSEEIQRLNNA